MILARAYDNPMPGFDTFNTISLRLWRSLVNMLDLLDSHIYNIYRHIVLLFIYKKSASITHALHFYWSMCLNDA
jgi:starch phosphorylase